MTNRKGVAHMIEQAMDTFKGLHAVINPAGILRDTMFHKMTDEDWDMVVDVHLNGAYNVTRATINHFREQNEGSYVLFTSTSGLIGNIGQANYAAVKMGVVGLSRIIAMEGPGQECALQHHRAVCLVAHDRDDPRQGRSVRQARRPHEELYARRPGGAACGVLASPACKDVNGQIFAARGNEIFLMSQPRPVRGMGKLEGWTPATIAEHCMAAMKPSFTDLQPTTGTFGWDPV